MWYVIIFAICIAIFYFRFVLKVDVDILSFLRRGFHVQLGQYGVYCFTGKQGSGKTFSTVQFILKMKHKFPVYSNIHLNGINYTYFSGFDELLNIKDHHCIIVYDEIFTALTRTSRLNNEVLSFLSQMRKKNIIFITTAQEWLEINITLRRYVRYQIDCKIVNLLPFSILIEQYHDGEKMKWSSLENEYVAPIVATKISKMAKRITKAYDTWEVISTTSSPMTKVTDNELDNDFYAFYTKLQPTITKLKDAAHSFHGFAGFQRGVREAHKPANSSKTPPELSQSKTKSSGDFDAMMKSWYTKRGTNE